MKTDSGDQQSDISDPPRHIKLNDILEQIKRKQKNIDIKLFCKYLPYKRPYRMVKVLNCAKIKADNNHTTSLIDDSFN